MGKRLSNDTFVDMMIQIEKEREDIQKSKIKIKNIHNVYGLKEPGYNVRKAQLLQNTTLDKIIKQTDG